MKKIYVNPEMRIVKIHARQQMMAGSVQATIYGTQNNGDALGRDFDFDDED